MEGFFKFNYIDQVVGALIGNVVGDALGIPVVFSKREDLKSNPVLEMQGFGSYLVAAGTWSENTSMSLALMDSVRECKRINVSDIMNKLSRWVYLSEYTANSETINVNTTIELAAEKFKRGTIPQDCGDNFEFASDNGALVRILPVALLCHNYNIVGKQRYEVVSEITKLTHANEKCIMANLIFVNFVCYLMDGFYPAIALQRTQQECYNFFSDACVARYDRLLVGNIAELPEDEIRSSSDVIDTLEAAIWSLITTRNYETAVIRAVNLGSDTAAIGALTGAIAGGYYGENAIPKRWLDQTKKIKEIKEIATSFAKTDVTFEL